MVRDVMVVVVQSGENANLKHVRMQEELRSGKQPAFKACTGVGETDAKSQVVDPKMCCCAATILSTGLCRS